MLTAKRQQKNRRQFLIRFYIILTVVLLGVASSYFTALKLFGKSGYVSPLAKIAQALDNSDKDINLIKDSLNSQKVEMGSVKKENQSYVITLKNNEIIILSTTKDLKQQLSSLQFILSRLTMEGRRFSRLDLTFDKPIILLEK